MDLVLEIKKHITSGENDEAIEKLMEYAQSQDGDFENKAILIVSQYNDWKKSQELGLDPEPEELRRIQYRIMKILPDTEDKDFDFLKFSVGDLPEEDVTLFIEDIPLSDSKIFKRGVAGIERKFNWLCKLYLNIDSTAFKILSADNLFHIQVEQVEIKQNLDVYSKNANTERSFGFWNMKAAKDTEFWSNANQKSKDMISERIKIDSQFRDQIYRDLQKLIAKKIKYKSPEKIEITSIRLYDRSTFNFAPSKSL